jgi:DNA-nicking Smr family endonuclease
VGQAARRDADEGTDLFREAVQGATPLADRHRVPVSGRANGAPGRSRESHAERLQVDPAGGRAFGVSRRTMRDLAAGRPPPQASLDLHRRTSIAAREHLARFLAESRAAGLRSVLVITGKGREDEGRPRGLDRLRDQVPDWLSGPLATAVLAFTPARAEHGGAGAYYVLLRAPQP